MNDPAPNESDGVEDAIGQPIAVVGIGCRLPGGVDSPDEFWRLLAEGRDAITKTPADRWDRANFYRPGSAVPSKTQSQWGGYVDGLDQFDPSLFRISPREAAAMDPQQRMLLEVAYRAIEDAGVRCEALAGRCVSVFAGISSIDYAVAGLSVDDRGEIGPYSNTGSSTSIAANRLSYCFDLRGPSVAVDTACSSSLVALHMACQSIWRGEAEAALAGGVNALILPDFFIAFSQLGVLSPDGRCKTFDASANGYARSEGAGMVLLKPLSKAQADGDRIYCVIRATALNQDGRTPGLTVPSGEQQERLVRRACRLAGIRPSDVGYVEAHGTGTSVGDPIEAAALARALGTGRNRPCHIGSVKTNVGHLEAGAGITSLIKVALSLHHEQIPPHLHLQTPNPEIDFERWNLSVPTSLQPWQHGSMPRVAGINGFGYGGANAHVVVGESPRRPTRPTSTTRRGVDLPPVRWLPISATDQDSFEVAAAQLKQWLIDAGDEGDIDDIAATAAHHRTHHDVRGGLVGRSIPQWIDQFDSLEPQSKLSPAMRERGVAFLCCGQGPQWWAMGRTLIRDCAPAREMMERIDAEFQKHEMSWTLLDELGRDANNSRMHRTSIAQPALFALQVAQAAAWKSVGMVPSLLIGHSVGEIAAAHLAGALTMEDACRVAIHRGRTMDLATSRGAMIAAGISEDEGFQRIQALSKEHPDLAARVSLAAVNGPQSITLSGDSDAIETIAQSIESDNLFLRRLEVEYAFHSPQMEPARDELMRSLSGIQTQPTHTPMISTVTGRYIDDGMSMGADYWWTNVRQGVRFADAVMLAAREGHHIAVELGPHPVLSFATTECFGHTGEDIHMVATARRPGAGADGSIDPADDHLEFIQALARLHSLGVEPDWSAVVDRPIQRASLPIYPMRRTSFWVESDQSRRSRIEMHSHPLLGHVNNVTSAGDLQFRQRLDPKTHAFLLDHQVRSAAMFPAAASIEMALSVAMEAQRRAAEQSGDDPADRVRLSRLQLKQALVLDESTTRMLTTQLRANRNQVDLASGEVNGDETTTFATAGIRTPPKSNGSGHQDILSSARDRCTQPFDGEACYDYCESIGLNYSGAFRGIRRGMRVDGESIAEVRLAASVCDERLRFDADQFLIHPAVLDSCFHAMVVCDPLFGHSPGGLYLPHEIADIQLIPELARGAGVDRTIISHATIRFKDDHRLIADVNLTLEDGTPIGHLHGFESRRIGGESDRGANELMYRYRWQRGEPKEDAAEIDDGGTGESVTTATQVWFAGPSLTDTDLANARPSGDDLVVVRMQSDSFHADHVMVDTDVASMRRVLKEILKASKHDEVHFVYLWGIEVVSPGELESLPLADAGEALRRDARYIAEAPLHLVQAWESIRSESAEPIASARMSIVTRGAQSGDEMDSPVDVSQMPLVGLGRVVVSEIASLETRLIDASCDEDWLTHLIDELGRLDNEDEVMLRETQRWVQRFIPDSDRDWSLRDDDDETPAFKLVKGAASGVDDLRHQAMVLDELASTEIEIEVAGAGLNFSDVMKVLDLYPGLPPGPVDLGAECSGIVRRVGSEVTEFRPGDRVIAVAPGGFASRVVVESCLVAPAPASIDLVDAAAIPVAWLTADHAINTCARMRAGESILIHSASGGVGLAAIDIAQQLGVEVFATAGNDTKRRHVAARNVGHCFDSRSLDFADQILEITQHREQPGVDAVLNSLPGEAIAAGLSTLKTGGRFLEIGKRDIYGDHDLGLYPFRNNLALFAIDLDQLFKQQAVAMGRRLRRIVEQIDAGDLRPEPPKRFSAAEAAGAFRFMQAAKHIGKVVVDYTQPPAQIRSRGDDVISFRSDATYWLAGGLGGFGLPIAQWMAEHGAGTLVLSGRSATPTPEAAATIDQMRQSGIDVVVLPCDVTDAGAVTTALEQIQSSCPPLRGVMHTAMVLQDKLLVDLDDETLHRVLWPKVIGGWNLHHATKSVELDHFILFSSLSSVFGHAGQANYSAANAMLDGLGHHRRVSGLPATVMNWGHVGEVGYLARREELSERLRRQGVLDFTLDEATSCLATALNRRVTQTSVLRMDWSRWRGLGLTKEVSPRFAHLIRGGSANGGSTLTAGSLREASPAQRLVLLRDAVAGKLASLLGSISEDIDQDRPMLELGLDSLMAVELRNWIEGQLQLPLQIGALMRGSSVSSLVDQLHDSIDSANVSESADNDVSETGDKITPNAFDATGQPDTDMCDRGRFPMSDQQTGLWYSFRRNPEGTSFNVFLPTRIRSPLNVDSLHQSMLLIVARHACLRTTFTDEGGKLTQVVHDDLPVEFEFIDVQGEINPDDAADMAMLQQRVIAETQRPFDLENGPLLRMKVFKLAEDDHLAVATTHHIVVDFWSLILILNELREYYPRLAAGETPEITLPPQDYFDFVSQQRQLLQSPRGEMLRREWEKTLDGIPTVLEVPTDRVRPSAFTGRAKVVPITCPRSIGRSVNAMASQTHTTSAAVVFAAVQVLLQRLTRQNRFVIGSPFAGRTQSGLEDTVGFFVNMLPLVADLTGQPSFTQLVRRAGNRLVDSMQIEEYPFAQIVRDVDPPRDTGRSPLIQVSCTFEKAHVREEEGRAGYLFPVADEVMEVGGLRQENFYVPHQTCHYDIEFIFEQSGDDLRGMIVYCEDLYEVDTMTRMSSNFSGLLAQLLDRPQDDVRNVPWSDEALRSVAPTPPVDAPSFESLTSWLASSCDNHTDATVCSSETTVLRTDERPTEALSRYRRRSFFNSKKPKPTSPSLHPVGESLNGHDQDDPAVDWTYGNLAMDVEAIASTLQRFGIEKNDVVPVAAVPGMEAMTMAVAAMRIGAVPVPIDVTKASVTAAELVKQTSAEVVLVDTPSDWSDAVSGEAEIISWQEARTVHATGRKLPGLDSITSSDLAYLIYTSGTTGTPKAVMIPHCGIVNTLAWRDRITPIDQTDRMFMPLSHQFDAGFGMSLFAMVSGATLVFPSTSNIADIDRLIGQIIDENVTILVGVPAWIDLIASHPRFSQATALRHIWVGGEAMPESLPKLIRQSSDAQIWNCYGPTEASVEATAFRIDDIHSKRTIPVGFPADHTDVVILDATPSRKGNRILPDTIVGEIALTGNGLADGYLHRQDLTDEVFIQLEDGRRAYRTGDQGRKRTDGLVEVLGRLDRQVKIGGYRIEPVEIETVLRDHVAVAQAAVITRSIHATGAESLIAFVELEPGVANMAIPRHRGADDQPVTQQDVLVALRHHLAEHLPPYKRPRHIEFMTSLPINASGKVDLGSLPDVASSIQEADSIAPPSTPLERYLVETWGATLALDQIGVSHNFFEYGGTSLQAAMLTNQLSDELGVSVPSSLLFDLADIASMAQRLVQLYPAELRKRFGEQSVRFYDGKISASERVGDVDVLIAPLKPTGSLPPLFMIHPPGGIVVCYRELAAALPEDQPLIAIRSRGLHGREELPPTMEEMAREYVDAIRSRQPEGPYNIGGWSIGGIVATEVARQLIEDGSGVHRLVLLDTSIPTGASDRVPAADQTNVGLEYGIDMTLDELVELKPEEQLPFLWQHAEKMGILDESTPPEVAARAVEDLKHLFHHHIELARQHKLSPIDVDVLMVRPRDVPFDIGTSEDRGWSHLASRVIVRSIPGHHHSMVQMPQVTQLADVIMDSIATATATR
ncbi:MAG: SDR family NAD(P)-dependent oxidoreductase [Planctomycetota bacterium]